PLREDQARWLIMAKTVAGPRNYRLEPPPTRDRKAREIATSRIGMCVESPWFRRWELRTRSESGSEDELAATGPELLRGLVTDLVPDPETLDSGVLDRLERTASELEE